MHWRSVVPAPDGGIGDSGGGHSKKHQGIKWGQDKGENIKEYWERILMHSFQVTLSIFSSFSLLCSLSLSLSLLFAIPGEGRGGGRLASLCVFTSESAVMPTWNKNRFKIQFYQTVCGANSRCQCPDNGTYQSSNKKVTIRRRGRGEQSQITCKLLTFTKQIL